MQRVPIIVSQSDRYLQLEVPSKSEPGLTRVVEYKPNGDRECSCPGAYWFREKGQDLYKLCRHQKMTTINEQVHNWPYDRFCEMREMVRTKRVPLYVIWGNHTCMNAENRNDNGIHCTGCPLYPKVCNIHKIKYGNGPRARLPLIWKLQTACYNNERTRARKLINAIILALRKEMETGQ